MTTLAWAGWGRTAGRDLQRPRHSLQAQRAMDMFVDLHAWLLSSCAFINTQDAGVSQEEGQEPGDTLED